VACRTKKKETRLQVAARFLFLSKSLVYED
jgi:hypothetical protein